MNRRNFLRMACIGSAGALVCGACGSLAAPQSEAGTRPNIVFIMIDDLGWKDLGCTGSDFYETPCVDRLASEGMRFTQAYANAANCAPTRACIMTGLYPPRHGVYTVANSDRGPARDRKLIPVENNPIVSADHVLIPEALKAAGYATFHAGKWHLGDGDTGPLGQGFDVNIGGNQAGSPPGGYFSPYKNKDLPDGPQGECLTDRLASETVGFIRDHCDGPFFVYLPFYTVHTPIQGKEDLVEKYRRKREAREKAGIALQHYNPTYAAMVETMDANVGRVLDSLDELGIADETFVLFFSDNGGYGGATNMRPLRGSKGMFYEGGIREPMIVRWPGRARPGSECDTPVISTDFYPTFLEVAGAPTPPGKALDGVSLAPLLRGDGGLERDELFWHFPCYLQGYRGDSHGEDSHDPGWRSTPCGVIRKGDWKLIEYFEEGDLELFNLKDDPGESTNLADAMPDKVAELHDRMKAWRTGVNAPVPTERNPEYAGTR